MTAPVPTVLHVVESWRPIATGYTSRGWHVVEHQAQENISRPRVLVTSRQQVHGGGGILVPPGVPVRLLDPSPAERRWRRWRRWYVDRAALAAHITHAADGADLIHVHWASAIGAAAADAAEELGIPLVAEVRFDLAGAFTSETLALPAPFERALRRRFEVHLARAAQVVAASRSLAGLLMDQFPALKSRITVVPNGVAQTLPARRCIRSSDRVTFGTTANMLRYEGLEQLIDAVEGLGGVDLLFIGGGPQRAALERRARRAGIAAEFVGHVPSSEIPAQLSPFGCFRRASAELDGHSLCQPDQAGGSDGGRAARGGKRRGRCRRAVGGRARDFGPAG